MLSHDTRQGGCRGARSKRIGACIRVRSLDVGRGVERALWMELAGACNSKVRPAAQATRAVRS